MCSKIVISTSTTEVKHYGTTQIKECLNLCWGFQQFVLVHIPLIIYILTLVIICLASFVQRCKVKLILCRKIFFAECFHEIAGRPDSISALQEKHLTCLSLVLCMNKHLSYSSAVLQDNLAINLKTACSVLIKLLKLTLLFVSDWSLVDLNWHNQDMLWKNIEIANLFL